MDKHRLLIPTVKYGSVSGIKVQDPTGTIIEGDTLGMNPPDEFFIGSFPREFDVKDKGSFSVEVLFKEGPAESLEVSEGLDMFSGTVLRVVELLEKFIQ